jgi:signal transduction histidine kinase
MDSLSQEVFIIVIVCAFFLMVATGIIFLVLIYQKRQLRFLIDKQELENRYSEELLKTRIETQEQTLNTISREIHDNIGQLLNSSKTLLAAHQRKMNIAGVEFQNAEEQLGQAIHELRALSRSLNGEWLERFNFIENLNTEAARINASDQAVVNLRLPPSLLMPKERQLILYRMVQEAFQNSLKHSGGNSIFITANQNEARIAVSITDNGKGFDANENQIQGFGMNSIAQRAQLMGGTAKWISDNTGTGVHIEVPLNSNGGYGH